MLNVSSESSENVRSVAHGAEAPVSSARFNKVVAGEVGEPVV